jgi:threonine synthase
MAWRSYLTDLACSACDRHHRADAVANVCACGKPLLARYDLDAVRGNVRRDDIAARPATLWRYRELLPVRSAEHAVGFGEGMTPLIPAPAIGGRIGVPRLLVKDESMLPTGTFKARGGAVGVSRARELGIRRIAIPTNGNAGAAWATYGARAGVRTLVAMPRAAPRVTRTEIQLAGGQLELVDGLISDAGRRAAEAVAADGYFDAGTLREPYRIEGKKTMGFEIAEQLGWRTPDVIVCPTGGGVGLIAIDKAVAELRRLGWLPDAPAPRFVSVQAAGCAPIVRAFEAGATHSEPWPDGQTLAFGINVGKALGDFLVLDAVRRSQGTAVAVPDEQIFEMQRRCYAAEGIFLCPEGAAALAAVEELRGCGWIDEAETILVLNTGTGLKYVS